LCIAINELIRERDEDPASKEYDGLENDAFTNEQIWNKCKLVMDGMDIWGKSEAFYSTEYGKVTHRRISGLIQSKFKAEPFKTSGDNSRRGWQFQREILDRITSHYTNDPKEIIILTGTAQQGKEKTASDASHASHYKSPEGDFNENSSENFASGPGQNTVQRPSSGPVVERTVDHQDTNTIPNTNTNTNDKDNDNNIAVISANKYDNNCDITEINPIVNSGPDLSNSRISLPITCNRQRNQIKLYSNIQYRHIPCLYCAYKDPLDFDLSLHYIENHRQHLIRLSLGKSSIDDRADYAVELSKRKLFESLDEDSEDDNGGDEEGDDEGDE